MQILQEFSIKALLKIFRQGPLNLSGLGLTRTSVRGLGSTMRTIGTTTLEIFVPGSSREFPARPPAPAESRGLVGLA